MSARASVSAGRHGGRGALVVLLLVLVGAACSRPGEAKPEAAPPVPVTVIRPERRAIARTISLTAGIEAYEQAPIYAKVPGYVAEIAVDIGDRVAEGQRLATLEMPEMAQQYAQAESALAERRAELAKANAETALQKVQLARSRNLRAKDAITEQDLDQSTARSATAVAAVDLATARIGSAEARLAELRALMSYAELRAPFAGVVTRRYVDRGALVQAATSNNNVRPVVIVARVDKVRVFTDVPEPDVPFIGRDLPATLEVAATPGRRFTGQITRFAGALDPSSCTMHTEVDFDNPDGALLPGMYGTLVIDVETHPDALTVPEEAVRVEKAKTVVFVVDGDHAAVRAVKTGFAAEHRVEILEGLGDGETLIASASAVVDGTPVQVTRTPEQPRAGRGS
ncbi:MAG: efflux RND transporter periplasmic adaptor subunit [Deltaproteobacteria bacterium]|nr:efflux RND transporter periplasmic adaptor subunit [Deltaproteobacteria bacterium]